MRFHDFVSMALLTIGRQKTRTALSLIGVVIGSLMLLYALSARRGVQDAVARVFSVSKEMRQIAVHPQWEVDEDDIPEEELQVDGELDEAMRSRIRNMLVRQWQFTHRGARVGLTRERIESLEALPHVQSVHPEAGLHVSLVQEQNELRAYGTSIAAGDEILRERILVGNAFETDSEQTILLNEFVAWQWGSRSPSQMRKLVGTKVRAEHRSAEETLAHSISFRSSGTIELSREEISALNSALDRLPAIIEQLPLPERERAALKKAFPSSPADRDRASEPTERIIAQEFTVAGIFRGPTEDETKERVQLGRGDGMSEFVLPIKTATRFALRFPNTKRDGFYGATVLVDHESQLREISEQIREMGLSEHSMIVFVEFIQKQVRQVTLIVSLIGLFALVISAIGIANTMVMSVVERTREIGVMKALGAREGQIQLLFLMEGALIGLIGGTCALIMGLVIKLPIESVTIWILESELNRRFEQEHMIDITLWLLGAVLAFSMVVTTLATILPARRAARIDPIAALRHD